MTAQLADAGFTRRWAGGADRAETIKPIVCENFVRDSGASRDILCACLTISGLMKGWFGMVIMPWATCERACDFPRDTIPNMKIMSDFT